LTMIMRGATPRALCWREGLAVLGLATLLPLLPTLARADDEESDSPRRRVAVERRSEDDKGKKEARSEEGSPEMEKAKAELKRLEAELQKKVSEVREASMRLKEAAEKIHRVEIDKIKIDSKAMAKELADVEKLKIDGRALAREIQGKIMRDMHIEVDGKEMNGRKMILDGPIEIEVTTDGHTVVRRIGRAEGHGVRGLPTPGPAAAPGATAPPGADVRSAVPVPPRNQEFHFQRDSGTTSRGSGSSIATFSASGPDNRRIEELERKLDAVMSELKKMRAENSGDQRKANKEQKLKAPKADKRKSQDDDDAD
jgi:hypothetical protein